MASQLGKAVKRDPKHDESMNPKFQPTIAPILVLSSLVSILILWWRMLISYFFYHQCFDFLGFPVAYSFYQTSRVGSPNSLGSWTSFFAMKTLGFTDVQIVAGQPYTSPCYREDLWVGTMMWVGIMWDSSMSTTMPIFCKLLWRTSNTGSNKRIALEKHGWSNL